VIEESVQMRPIRTRTGRKNATSIKNDSARGLGQANWYPGVGMSVYPFLREAVFEPEIIQVMAGAYEELLGDLELLDRNDPFTEVVAKEVIEAARLGLHDVPAMRQWVLDTLGKPH
jgi:hypothetical protein